MSYKAIKYEQEYENNHRLHSTSYTFILFCVLFPFIGIACALIIGIFSKHFLPQYAIPLIIIFLLILLSIPVLMYFRHRRIRREEDVFRKMRKRFKAQGTLYHGVITGIKEIKTTEEVYVKRRPREVVATRYTYTAKYTDGNSEEKEIESYILLKADKGAIGRTCIIYECEGKALLDAIEQDTQ